MPDKAARIAALIRALDQVSARQMGQPGGISPDADPIVQGLVAQGDDAVQPLIDAVRTDPRLTRSVGFGRDFFQARSLVSVSGAAYAALVDILHTSEFTASPPTWEGRAETAAALQAYWDKYHGFSVAERWYRTLADDGAAPKQWLEAAHEIIRPGNEELQGGWVVTTPHPGVPVLPHGESLRRGHTPSVSALMARRVGEFVAISQTRGNDSRPIGDVENATEIALYLAAWDPQAARSVLRDQFEAQQKINAFWIGKLDVRSDALKLTSLTLARVQSGDPAALHDYLHWLQGTPLQDLPVFSLSDILAPLWRSPDDPAVVRGAAFLFNDPASPWVPLIQERPGGLYGSAFENLLESPLLGLAPFRQAVLTALADRTVIQSVTLGGPDQGADDQIIRHDVDPFRPAAPQAFPVRRCDLYAWHLSHLDGMPAFQYDLARCQEGRRRRRSPPRVCAATARSSASDHPAGLPRHPARRGRVRRTSNAIPSCDFPAPQSRPATAAGRGAQPGDLHAGGRGARRAAAGSAAGGPLGDGPSLPTPRCPSGRSPARSTSRGRAIPRTATSGRRRRRWKGSASTASSARTTSPASPPKTSSSRRRPTSGPRFPTGLDCGLRGAAGNSRCPMPSACGRASRCRSRSACARAWGWRRRSPPTSCGAVSR